MFQLRPSFSELGRAAREAAEARVQTMKEGFQKRKLLSVEGLKIKQDKEKELEALRLQKDELDPKRDELDMKKQDVESQEKEAKDRFRKTWEEERDAKRKTKAIEAFGELDVNKDQKITPDEVQTRTEFDKDADGAVSVEEAKDYLIGKEESDLDHFVNEVWLGIRKIYKPLSEEQPEAATTTPPPPAQETPPPPTTPPQVDEEGGGESEDEEEVKEDDVDDFDEDKYMDGKVLPPDDDETEPPYDKETQAFIDAAEEVRKDYNEVDRQFKDIESKIKDEEAFLQTDFGAEFEWAPLQGKCYEMTDSQYTYRLCVFDRSTQKDKGGSHETVLGNWKQWDGPEDAKFSVQRYSGGQSCWNGPERSTMVHMHCGLETRLMAASEPGRCEYRMDLETPAACADPSSLNDAHIEL